MTRTRNLLAIAAAVAAVATVIPATTASAAEGPPRPLCYRDQLYRTDTAVIRNDVFGSGRECVAVKGRAYSWWRVTRTDFPANGRVNAFPNIYYGWEYGHGSAGTVLPERVSRAATMRITWQTFAARPAGQWNKTLDFWLSRSYQTDGQTDGAELMIWLDATYPHPSDARLVQVENKRWWLVLRRPCSASGTCWNRLSFWPYRIRSRVRRMPLAPFLRYGEGRGLLHRWWFLDGVDAGNEIYFGGTGLGTIKFAVTP